MRKTVLAATVATVAVALPAAASAAKPAPYVPNSTASVQAIVKQLDQLNSFLSGPASTASGQYWCRLIDDAPTKKSTHRTAVIQYCVPVGTVQAKKKTAKQAT